MTKSDKTPVSSCDNNTIINKCNYIYIYIQLQSVLCHFLTFPFTVAVTKKSKQINTLLIISFCSGNVKIGFSLCELHRNNLPS